MPIFAYIRRLFIGLAVLFAVVLNAAGQSRNPKYERYIDQYSHLAVQQMNLHAIPASITMAQGLLESGAGTSELAVKTNNHFGIKQGANWNGPVYQHADDRKDDKFRVYKRVEESYEDHSKILLKPRYQSLFQLDIHDYKGWARGLRQCGYATDPAYADRLISIIERYELYKLDGGQLAANNNAENATNNWQTHHHVNNQMRQAEATGREFLLNNDKLCVRALPGDTWQSIAKQLGISKRRLLKYNEAAEYLQIHPGDFIYLEKKAKKGPKSMKHKWHKVTPNDSMYSIAQRYGIRLKNLYKLNFKDLDYIPRPGDLIKVR